MLDLIDSFDRLIDGFPAQRSNSSTFYRAAQISIGKWSDLPVRSFRLSSALDIYIEEVSIGKWSDLFDTCPNFDRKVE